jgi:hypothetical protein
MLIVQPKNLRWKVTSEARRRRRAAMAAVFGGFHLAWFLFGFYPYEVPELVVISMTSSSTLKMDFALLLHF